MQRAQGRRWLCHSPPIRPCGAVCWFCAWPELGLRCRLAMHWRRGGKRRRRRNPNCRARTASAPNPAAAVRRMPIPAMNQAMVAARRAVGAAWKRPMPTQAINRAGGAAAMASPMPIPAICQAVGAVQRRQRSERLRLRKNPDAPSKRQNFNSCSDSSTSWKLGIRSVGTILRPVSTATCGALPCRCATSTARITS